MSNYILNRLTFAGDQSKIDELVAKFSTDYPEIQCEAFDGSKTFRTDDGVYGWLKDDGSFTRRGEGGSLIHLDSTPPEFKPFMEAAWTRFPDFEKVAPKPEDLDITSDGLVNYLENEFSERGQILELKNSLLKADLASVENFCKAVMNLKKYGHASWYGWSVANWGTKWNCSQCEKKDGNVWEFTTAWNGVIALIAKISAEFPEVNILYEFADEDTGSSTCGMIFFQDGEIKSQARPESQSNDAYELCFKLRPHSAENYHLVDGKYEYREEDGE